MPPADKIKRAITWIRKTLEITDKTTLPGTVVGEIRPTLDVLGWERYQQQTALTKTGTAVNNVTSEPVPADTMRLITAASIETDDHATNSYIVWLEHTNSLTGLVTGLARTQTLAISVNNVRPGMLERVYLLSPGDTINARASPNVAAGKKLRLRWTFIDLPLGEYIPGL